MWNLRRRHVESGVPALDEPPPAPPPVPGVPTLDESPPVAPSRVPGVLGLGAAGVLASGLAGPAPDAGATGRSRRAGPGEVALGVSAVATPPPEWPFSGGSVNAGVTRGGARSQLAPPRRSRPADSATPSRERLGRSVETWPIAAKSIRRVPARSSHWA